MTAAIQASCVNQTEEFEPEGLGNTLQCRAWRERIYSRHIAIASHLRHQHKKRVGADGYVSANQWLGSQEKALKIGRSGLFCDSSDHELKDYAEAKSKKIEKQIHEAANTIGTTTQLEKDRISDFIREEVETAGIDYPLPEYGYTKDEMIAAMARVCDPIWWRKQLRKTATRQYEGLARKTGAVSLSHDIYCSDFSLRRRLEQKRRNRLLLESLEAENSQGQVFTLAELSDLSESNPINRRHGLMARIAGFERYAQNKPFLDPINGPTPYICLFLTLTVPSKYHAMSIRRRADGSRYAIPNPKFCGSTPRQVNDYLCHIWAEIRSEWARREIHPFGFRMAEPHHDGTPHWHMVLFIPKHKMIEASYVFQHYALRENPEEAGAAEYRSKIVYIDPTKGSAAGYCAKYVSKNIDGFGIDADLYGRDAITSAMRIEAWASTNGIRQFQQIGGPSVTVWREARRIEEEVVDCTISKEAKAIIAAADCGDWERYTELMGGAICPRKDRPIRPMMINRQETNNYNEITTLLIGLLAFNTPLMTRNEVWKIQPVGTAEAESKGAPRVSALEDFFLLRGPPGRTLDLCQ